MPQIFPAWTNRLPLIVALLGAAGSVGAVAGVWYFFSPEYTDVGYAPVQPVPYSHRLHAGELGIDCRYCHDTIERSAAASIPTTETCMNCHRKIQAKSDKLAWVRRSAETGEAIPWVRVHMLPDYTYFDHSIHVAAGVGCVKCHGRVDQMETVTQRESLSMSWCLDCHRDPTPSLRPVAMVTKMEWNAAEAGYDPHNDPRRTRGPSPPTHCSGCHR